MNKTFTLLGLVGLAACGFAVACSSSDSNPTRPTGDGGAGDDVAGDDVAGDDTASGDGGAGACTGDGTNVAQHGRVVKFGTEAQGVPGATVAIGGGTFTSDEEGYYCAKYAKDTAVQMTVSAAGFYTLIDSEWKLSTDGERGDTRLLPEETAKLFLGVLDGYDATKAVATALVDKVTGCSSSDGTTVTVDGQPDAKIVYMVGNFPTASQASIKDGEDPGIAVYNLDPTKPLKFISTGGTCKQPAYPQTFVEHDGQAAFVYTGNVGIKAADTKTLSAVRLFLGAP